MSHFPKHRSMIFDFVLISIYDTPQCSSRTYAVEVVIVVFVAIEEFGGEEDGSVFGEDKVFSNKQRPASNGPFDGRVE